MTVPPTDGRGLFVPRPGEVGEDFWQVFRLAISEALANRPDGVILLRLDGLKGHLGPSWESAQSAVDRLLRAELAPVLADGAMMAGFGPAAYVLVCGPRAASLAWRNDVMARVGRGLPGFSGPGAALEPWAVRGLRDDGLTVEPLADRGDKPHPSAPAPSPAKFAPQGKRMVLQDASFTFDPLWDVRRNMVLAYHCRPHWDTGRGTMIEEEDLDDNDSERHLIFAMDLETLHKAGERIEELVTNDSMAVLMVPVHWETLADQGAAANYLRAVETQFYLWGERLLFEILRIPQAVGAERLLDVLRCLDKRGRGFLLRRDWSFADAAALRPLLPLGLQGIGVDAIREARPEAEVMIDMETFIDQVAAHSLHSYILGVGSVSLSVAAVCAGFDYVGSRPVSRVLEPWGLDDHVVKPMDLFREFLHGKKGRAG